MPLAVKPLPHAYADAGEEEILTAEARLAQFVRAEIDRALRDVDRRKRLAEMDLARQPIGSRRPVIASSDRCVARPYLFYLLLSVP